MKWLHGASLHLTETAVPQVFQRTQEYFPSKNSGALTRHVQSVAGAGGCVGGAGVGGGAGAAVGGGGVGHGVGAGGGGVGHGVGDGGVGHGVGAGDGGAGVGSGGTSSAP